MVFSTEPCPFLYAAVFTIFTPNEYQVINKTIIPYI